jgi:hypothetical protein
LFVSTVGVWSIKQFYFYIVKRNELDLYKMDYIAIGSLSGLFTFFIIFGVRGIYLAKGSLFGALYGFIYNRLINHFSRAKQTRAEKLGIKL